MQWVSKIMGFGIAGITTVLTLSPALVIFTPTVVSISAAAIITNSNQTNVSQKSSIGIFKDWTDVALNILSIVAILTGAYFAVKIYRETKLWIQLDIDTNLYKLSNSEDNVTTFTRDRKGKLLTRKQKCTHALEVLLKFNNKGKIRFKLYNLQIGISTMRKPNQAKCRANDGHLSLINIFTSGNIVPIILLKPDEWREKLKFEFWVFRLLIVSSRLHSHSVPRIAIIFCCLLDRPPINKHSYYYIEPNVEQTIHYLALITQPRELLQVWAKFSLEEERIFPYKERKTKKPFPHTAARTYQVDPERGTLS